MIRNDYRLMNFDLDYNWVEFYVDSGKIKN
jgi:hypothetical protein